MSKAVLCPVCQGTGKYYSPPSRESTSAVGYYESCHGCFGKGWVEVSEGKPILEGRVVPGYTQKEE